VDGLLYEAFNTSGGLGTWPIPMQGKVRTMNYKTLRYPGHCEKIHLLMKDLKLNEDRETSNESRTGDSPNTAGCCADLSSVMGMRDGALFEEELREEDLSPMY